MLEWSLCNVISSHARDNMTQHHCQRSILILVLNSKSPEKHKQEKNSNTNKAIKETLTFILETDRESVSWFNFRWQIVLANYSVLRTPKFGCWNAQRIELLEPIPFIRSANSHIWNVCLCVITGKHTETHADTHTWPKPIYPHNFP
jgi:hypothetical protein